MAKLLNHISNLQWEVEQGYIKLKESEEKAEMTKKDFNNKCNLDPYFWSLNTQLYT